MFKYVKILLKCPHSREARVIKKLREAKLKLKDGGARGKPWFPP